MDGVGKDILPYFKKSENYKLGKNRYHGEDGPLAVSEIIDKNPTNDSIIKAFHRIRLLQKIKTLMAIAKKVWGIMM